MSGLKSFVLAGVGNIGHYIADEILDINDRDGGLSLTIFSRPQSSDSPVLNALKQRGANIIAVDYEDEHKLASEITSAQADTVISCLGGPAISGPQTALVRASAKAGSVRLFVTSEFGVEKLQRKEKGPVYEELQQLNIPYAAIFNGGFSDTVIGPRLGFDFANGKVTIWGDGASANSFTARTDIARFLAYALTQLPFEQLSNKFFRIEGERISAMNIAQQYEATFGRKLVIEHRPIREREEMVERNPQDFVSTIIVALDRGDVAVTEKPEDTDNSAYPEWRPKSLMEVLKP